MTKETFIKEIGEAVIKLANAGGHGLLARRLSEANEVVVSKDTETGRIKVHLDYREAEFCKNRNIVDAISTPFMSLDRITDGDWGATKNRKIHSVPYGEGTVAQVAEITLLIPDTTESLISLNKSLVDVVSEKTKDVMSEAASGIHELTEYLPKKSREQVNRSMAIMAAQELGVSEIIR